jgi:hypothetical protein
VATVLYFHIINRDESFLGEKKLFRNTERITRNNLLFVMKKDFIGLDRIDDKHSTD